MSGIDEREIGEGDRKKQRERERDRERERGRGRELKARGLYRLTPNYNVHWSWEQSNHSCCHGQRGQGESG